MTERQADGGGAREPRARRPYEPPRIESEELFETTALACGKKPGQGAACSVKVKKS